jgi:hypothetical protein
MENLELYNLEEYLFERVGPGFRDTGSLSAFDFFCIVSDIKSLFSKPRVMWHPKPSLAARIRASGVPLVAKR